MNIKLSVPGTPASKGSYNIGRGGQFYPADKKLKAWQITTGLIARQQAPAELITGPVSLNIKYYMPGPAPQGEQHYIKRPDLDKLTRATMDAMTGIIYRDDAQVTNLNVCKLYTPEGYEPGAIIEATDPAMNCGAWVNI